MPFGLSNGSRLRAREYGTAPSIFPTEQAKKQSRAGCLGSLPENLAAQSRLVFVRDVGRRSQAGFPKPDCSTASAAGTFFRRRPRLVVAFDARNFE